jgi:hypothetical protein
VYRPSRQQTHCKRGHPLSGENLHRYYNGRDHVRVCLTCVRMRNSISNAKAKEARVARKVASQ